MHSENQKYYRFSTSIIEVSKYYVHPKEIVIDLMLFFSRPFLLRSHIDHVIKHLVQLIADFLDFHFLRQKILLNLINPHIQPLNVHLSILSPVGVDGIS